MKAEFFAVGDTAVRLLDTSYLELRTTEQGEYKASAFTRHAVGTGASAATPETVIARLRAKYNVVVFDEDGDRREYRSVKNSSKRITLIGVESGGVTRIFFPRWILSAFASASAQGEIKLKLLVAANGTEKSFEFPVDSENVVELVGSMAQV